LTAGKQQISLGTGYFSNPTDVFNIKDAVDPTYEQPGHNGIRLDWMLARRLQLLALYAPIEDHWERSGKLLRLKVGLGHFDLSALGIEIPYRRTDFSTLEVEEQRRQILGGDVVGELLGLGVWAEGAYSFLKDDEEFYEFLVGTDYTFESGLYGLLEYHHNSLGKGKDDELDLGAWMRFLTGETKTIARDQIYGFVQYPVTDLIALGSSFIYSVSDGSAALVPTAYWSLFENVELTLIVNLFVGEEGKVYSSALGNGGFLRARVYF
jgi:hypothetical protein